MERHPACAPNNNVSSSTAPSARSGRKLCSQQSLHSEQASSAFAVCIAKARDIAQLCLLPASEAHVLGGSVFMLLSQAPACSLQDRAVSKASSQPRALQRQLA